MEETTQPTRVEHFLAWPSTFEEPTAPTDAAPVAANREFVVSEQMAPAPQSAAPPPRQAAPQQDRALARSTELFQLRLLLEDPTAPSLAGLFQLASLAPEQPSGGLLASSQRHARLAAAVLAPVQPRALNAVLALQSPDAARAAPTLAANTVHALPAVVLASQQTPAAAPSAIPLLIQCTNGWSVAVPPSFAVAAPTPAQVAPEQPCPRSFRRQCPVCSSWLSAGSSMAAHIRTHTGERPFVCSKPGCGRAFAQRSNWRRHERTHSQEQRRFFPCEHCGAQLTRRYGLQRHMQTAHKAEVAQAAPRGGGGSPALA